MRDLSLRALLSESREGTQRDFDNSIPLPRPTEKLVTRAYNLSDMLDQALGSSEGNVRNSLTDETNQRIADLEKLKEECKLIIRGAFQAAIPTKVQRGYGLSDMLAEATNRSE